MSPGGRDWRVLRPEGVLIREAAPLRVRSLVSSAVLCRGRVAPALDKVAVFREYTRRGKILW